MKSDNLKRNDVSPAIVTGALRSTTVVVTNLSVTGPYRGDFQIVDEGRLIVGQEPDSGPRGILSPSALKGYGLNGGNSFALWFASVEGHTAGDFHAGNLTGNYLGYSQSAGTLGLYSAGGVGALLDNDGSFTAGDPRGAHMQWDVASASLKIMSGATVSAEFMSDGSAALGRMTLRDVLEAGDVDGPSVTLGRFDDNGTISAELIVTDNANNPWFHVVAGGGTAYGGYFSVGQQGSYEHRMTYDGEYLVVNGVLFAATGSEIGGWIVSGDEMLSGSGTERVGISSAGYSFYAGSETASSAPFRVTNKGELTASSMLLIGTTKIGDGGTTNYAQFDTTGHLTFAGTAKPWNDMLIEPTARNTGTNAPTFEKWYDDAAGTSRGVYLYSFDDAATNAEKEVFFTLQMSHAWDGGDIQFHVHWIGAVDDTTATPRWGLEYVFKEPGAVFGDSTIIYAVGNHLSEADITAHKHYITQFTTISPGSTANDLSSVLIGRLFRNSGDAADTYNATGAKCGLLYIDAHYQIARIGSTDEYGA